jgi:cell division protein FtsW
MERITAFLHPWADPTDTGYQLIQSLYALGSGGLFGVGLGLSKQKVFYLPLAHNDFIFAVIGEEFGFMGTLAVVAAFLLFTYAGIRIALECRDSFGRLLAGGLTAMIAMQAQMNMAAVTGLMPITGVTLPFVSSGGTSLTLTMACVGLIIAVSRYGGTSKVRLVRGKTTRGPKEDSIVRGSQDRANTAERRRNGGTHLSSLDGGGASSRRRP